mgnify:CR=1 FL=1
MPEVRRTRDLASLDDGDSQGLSEQLEAHRASGFAGVAFGRSRGARQALRSEAPKASAQASGCGSRRCQALREQRAGARRPACGREEGGERLLRSALRAARIGSTASCGMELRRGADRGEHRVAARPARAAPPAPALYVSGVAAIVRSTIGESQSGATQSRCRAGRGGRPPSPRRRRWSSPPRRARRSLQIRRLPAHSSGAISISVSSMSTRTMPQSRK